MKKLLTALLIIIGFFSQAQDIIVKNDKSEIKSKITEITESIIKYKKWEHQDGPLYSLNRNEVFMIIHANGQREIIKPASNAPATPILPKQNVTNNSSSPINVSSTSNIDTSLDYQNIKVKYMPGRLVYWLQDAGFTLGIQQEYRLVKNILNIGTSVDYGFSGDVTSTTIGLYAAPYAGLNRLMGKYEDQDKGAFFFGRLGYSLTSVSYKSRSASSTTLIFGLGADYYFTKKYGANLSFMKYGQSDFVAQVGISVSLFK
jgi:hypothetical protein